MQGVDEVGPYTLIAQKGEVDTQGFAWKKNIEIQQELRDYGNYRYRAVTTVVNPSYYIVYQALEIKIWSTHDVGVRGGPSKGNGTGSRQFFSNVASAGKPGRVCARHLLSFDVSDDNLYEGVKNEGTLCGYIK